MKVPEFPVSDVGTDGLEAYLESERSPPDSMLLSDLDGFLTAIAVGPELVMPSEWLPIVWGGEEPVFADQAEMQAVMGGIFSRYNEILGLVQDGTLDPIYWAAADDTPIAADWAEGFVQAMGLRPTAWDAMVDSEKGRLLLVPILALCCDENGDALLGGIDAATIDEIAAEAPELIPQCVVDIAAFWRARRDGRTATPSVRSGRKTGRNDPCPCGSGKKFKKCCGRAA